VADCGDKVDVSGLLTAVRKIKKEYNADSSSSRAV